MTSTAPYRLRWLGPRGNLEPAWRAGRDESEAFLPLLRKAILAAVTVTVLAVGFTLMNAPLGQDADIDEMVAATNSVNEAIDLVWTDDR